MLFYIKAFLESPPTRAPSTCPPQTPHLRVAEAVWLNQKGLLEAREDFQRDIDEIPGVASLPQNRSKILSRNCESNFTTGDCITKKVSQPVPDL